MKKLISGILVLLMVLSSSCFLEMLTVFAITPKQSDPISSTKAYGRRNLFIFNSEVTAGKLTSASGFGGPATFPFSVDRLVLLADGLSSNEYYDSATKTIVYDGVSYQLGSMTPGISTVGEGETGDAMFVSNPINVSAFTTKADKRSTIPSSDLSNSYTDASGTLTFTGAGSGYDRVSFLATNSYGYWNTIVASVRYTDGTFEQVKQFLTVPLSGISEYGKPNPMVIISTSGGPTYFSTNQSKKYIDALAGAIGAKAIIPLTQVQWLSSNNTQTGIAIPTKNSPYYFGGAGNNTAYVGIYDVPVDPAKVVKAIDFYKAGSDATAGYLGGEGVTSITGSGTSSLATVSYTDPDNSSTKYDAKMKLYRGNYGPFVLGATLYSASNPSDEIEAAISNLGASPTESELDAIEVLVNDYVSGGGSTSDIDNYNVFTGFTEFSELTISSIEIDNGSIASLNDAKGMTVSLTMTVRQPEGASVANYAAGIAVYTQGNDLSYVNFDISTQAWGDKKKRVTFSNVTIPSDVTQIKSFMFNSLDEITPLSESLSF